MTPASSPAESKPAERILSVDALRGFDMFWILGADTWIHALARLGNKEGSVWPAFRWLDDQMEHCEWAGFHFYDLIFPMFVFLAGVSIVFSIPKIIAREGRSAAYWRILRRTAIIFGLGLIYYGGFQKDWPEVRVMGVLQRIAIAYGAAAFLFCHLRWRGLFVACVAILLGYWALFAWVPIPNVSVEKQAVERALATSGAKDIRQLLDTSTNLITGSYARDLNLAHYVDAKYLGGAKHNGYWDPEGWLSHIPAIASCLLGVLTGLFITDPNRSPRGKATRLIFGGIAIAGLGWLWGLSFPVIKILWSSSYVLVAGGYSIALLGIFHWITEVLRWRTWCTPFVWIGSNAITLYVIAKLVGHWEGYTNLAERFVGGSVQKWLSQNILPGLGPLVTATLGIILMLALARFLYRRRIFLRV